MRASNSTCIDKVEVVVTFITAASSWSGIVDFKVGRNDVAIGVTIVQHSLLIRDATGLIAFATTWSAVLESVIVESASFGG